MIRQVGQKVFGGVNSLVGFSVARYVLAIGIFVGVVVFGFVSMRSLGVDLLPSTNIPVVNISTSYPGASPTSVDEEVTQVIESAVAQVPNVTSINSTSNTGNSRVTLQLEDGTDQNAAANQVASLVSGAARQLPQGAGNPSVRTFNPNAQPILEFGVSGGTASQADVYDYVNNQLVPALQRVEGVADVELSGGSQRGVEVLLDPNKLSAYGLTPQSVANAISGSNVRSSIGTVTREGNSLTYTTNAKLTSLDDIANVILDAAKGVRVSDVASVKDSSTATGVTRVNGLPVVLVSIQQTAGSNAVAVVDGVKALIAGIKLPAGYRVTYSNDTTGPIRASIASTTHELWITALVVALVTLLFLGRLNTALTVIAAIPISLAAAPILYKLMGFTFNQVSLLALIVAIGIVVDDSIVVAENVERYRAMGFGRVEAVLRGASEVFSAVAAASLSLLAVLIPVSFMGGIVGEYVKQFSLGLAAAVLLSWLEALLFLTVRMAYTPDAAPLGWRDVPRVLGRLPEAMRWGLASVRTWWFWVLAAAFLAVLWTRAENRLLLLTVLLLPLVLGVVRYLWGALLAVLEALTTTLHGLTDRLLVGVREAYVRSLDSALNASAGVLLIAAAFLVATVLLVVPRMHFTFTPATDSGTLRAGLRLPSGLSLNTRNELVSRLEGYFLRRPEVRSVQASVTPNGTNLNITLKPKTEREDIATLTGTYQQALRGMFSDYPDVRANVFSGGGFRGQGNSQSLTLVANNYDLLKQRAAMAVNVLEQNPNVLSASSSLDNTTLENQFVPNPGLLAQAGLTANTVAQALGTYGSGSSGGNVEIGGVTYPISVELDPQYLQDDQSLLSLPIYSNALQSSVTVGQLGSIVQASAPNSVQRTNRLYSLDLSIEPDPASKLTATQLQDQLTAALTRAGVIDNLVTVGKADRNSAFAIGNRIGSLGLQAFALSLLLVYLVMGAQFNSFRYPLYLLLPVPFAVAGAYWMMFLVGGTLDIFGVLGFLLLIGLSAKNAIIYLEFVVEQMQKLPLREALIEASRLRFRPIIMTTLTVLVISIPLLLNRGSGSEFGKSLSIIIVGGISVSALMTFYVVPAAFSLFERGRAAHPAVREAEVSVPTGPPAATPAAGA
ncbi:efflux RND transporter permease subunit [Deinococcus metallilatus]|uniref:Efflux RND transporter permease subunit n=1 Tax=Deinococcus metallilatus TaxID=1211322 RepID=A0AAJ5K512_9DEIO|nr:efflux RND transporter permease subunit [Deinococcus metallilatus]MBB5295390.1 HAE1 family hydrophobic/amphiphilic exporter-1 [Deinococcus metallilatus]QBY08080.1 efflux RND transporter permease subunit [Deinococcus metallilatus]RXJ12973.1 efflux RND transporter permease subunit [Deinococcus metallilatus]TLK27105.1 efflux RND transporter permease subunit [Deinococcus metallilatus]GMA16067.1 multidrug transporter [Deinococcus metallilatus]